MSRPKVVLFPALFFFLSVVAAGCVSSAEKRQKVYNIALFVEYIVRGDEENAGELFKQEEHPRFRRVYVLFTPTVVSLDDPEPRYPVFIEKRRNRFPTIREFKREGFVGESLSGEIKFVTIKENEPAEKQLLKGLIFKENFDRNNINAVIAKELSRISLKEVQQSFVKVRRNLSVQGDYIEVQRGIWEKVVLADEDNR